MITAKMLETGMSQFPYKVMIYSTELERKDEQGILFRTKELAEDFVKRINKGE